MPPRGAPRLAERRRLAALLDLQVGPHDRHAGDARHLRHLGVDLDGAEVGTEGALRLRREVLVAQEDDAALGDQQRQLVLLLVAQLRELQAVQLRADVRGQVHHFRRGGEEGAFGAVGAAAGVDVLSAGAGGGSLVQAGGGGWRRGSKGDGGSGSAPGFAADGVDLVQVLWLLRPGRVGLGVDARFGETRRGVVGQRQPERGGWGRAVDIGGRGGSHGLQCGDEEKAPRVAVCRKSRGVFFWGRGRQATRCI